MGRGEKPNEPPKVERRKNACLYPAGRPEGGRVEGPGYQRRRRRLLIAFAAMEH
jgi:hypothetical protein